MANNFPMSSSKLHFSTDVKALSHFFGSVNMLSLFWAISRGNIKELIQNQRIEKVSSMFCIITAFRVVSRVV